MTAVGKHTEQAQNVAGNRADAAPMSPARIFSAARLAAAARNLRRRADFGVRFIYWTLRLRSPSRAAWSLEFQGHTWGGR